MSEFIFSDQLEPHIIRRKEMLKKYPQEIRALMGNHLPSALWIFASVAVQFAIAYAMKDQGIGWILLTAYLVGAFINHGLYTFVHEATHNLVFKGTLANRFIGMFCDFALVAPGAMAFRKYHVIHHNRQGQYDSDADICSEFEADLIGNHWLKKLIWVFFLGVSQAMRPMRLKGQAFFDPWILGQLVLQAIVLTIAYQFLGVAGLGYLLASTIFGLGLHPLGGRWIAEHYVIKGNQETYSYYGPLNKLAFNIGYHNEHHDVMTIPWVNLPKLKALAPEFYNDLTDHPSYPGLLVRFIADPSLSLRSRVIRTAK